MNNEVKSADVKKEEKKIKSLEDFKFEVENGIEIPPPEKKPSKEGKLEEMFDKLEVSQSFFVPLEFVTDSSLSSFRTNIQKKLRERYSNNDLSFVIRPVKENGVPVGNRVWRTI